jgi:preprotein translocase subunit SecE
MTPKEKVNELIVKALVQFEKLTINEAKKISLIAVDECLYTCVESMVYYWKEVKQEIEKL